MLFLAGLHELRLFHWVIRPGLKKYAPVLSGLVHGWGCSVVGECGAASQEPQPGCEALGAGALGKGADGELIIRGARTVS